MDLEFQSGASNWDCSGKFSCCLSTAVLRWLSRTKVSSSKIKLADCHGVLSTFCRLRFLHLLLTLLLIIIIIITLTHSWFWKGNSLYENMPSFRPIHPNNSSYLPPYRKPWESKVPSWDVCIRFFLWSCAHLIFSIWHRKDLTSSQRNSTGVDLYCWMKARWCGSNPIHSVD